MNNNKLNKMTSNINMNIITMFQPISMNTEVKLTILSYDEFDSKKNIETMSLYILPTIAPEIPMSHYTVSSTHFHCNGSVKIPILLSALTKSFIKNNISICSFIPSKCMFKCKSHDIRYSVETKIKTLPMYYDDDYTKRKKFKLEKYNGIIESVNFTVRLFNSENYRLIELNYQSGCISTFFRIYTIIAKDLFIDGKAIVDFSVPRSPKSLYHFQAYSEYQEYQDNTSKKSNIEIKYVNYNIAILSNFPYNSETSQKKTLQDKSKISQQKCYRLESKHNRHMIKKYEYYYL